MNGRNIDMLSDDQIDYSNLSDFALRDLTLGDDLFVANSALVALSKRKSVLVETLARDILQKRLGDKYLQAAAINILFDKGPQCLFAILLKEVQDCDLYIFNTILELMIQEKDYFMLEESLPIVNFALRRIKQLDEGAKWPAPEIKDSFVKLYRSHSDP